MTVNVDMTGNSQLVTFGGGVPIYGSFNPGGMKATTTISTGNTMADSGTLNLQMSATGITVSSSGSTTTVSDVAIAVYTMAAGTFDQFGRGINIIAAGSMLTTTAAAKNIKIYVTNNTAPAIGSVVTSTAAVVVIGSTSGNVATTGTGWQVSANVFKTGALGSNTQLAIHEAAQLGATACALLSPTSLTLTESSAINLIVTIADAANNISGTTFNFLQVQGYN